MSGNGVDLHQESLETKHKAILSTGEGLLVAAAVKGTAPLLFHRYDVEAVESKGKAAKGSKEKKSDNLESYVYRNTEGLLCIPATSIKACLCDAARRVQDPSSPRRSARDLFRAAVIVEPFLVPLGPEPRKTWDAVDVRPVLVQRNRITRRRPMLNDGWELQFTINVLDPEMISEDVLADVLVRAGKFSGLGDFRPDFGRFRVEMFRKVRLQS